MRKKRHLSIEEKRDWLADIFRDASGEYTQADKFKALAEDTKLAQLQAEEAKADTKQASPQEDILKLLATSCDLGIESLHVGAGTLSL